MTDDLRDRIDRLYRSSSRFWGETDSPPSSHPAVALALTGGGVMAAGWLLSVPGSSQTIVEVAVPYASEAFDDYVAGSPVSYCSEETALRLARRARQRASWLAPGRGAVGIGCTASLRSDRPKRGDHRVHVAGATAEDAAVWSLTLTKEARSRPLEEEMASRLVLHALAYVLTGTDWPMELLPGEVVTCRREPRTSWMIRCGAAVCIEPDGRVREGGPPPGLLLCGSFNPLHAGHWGMMEAAARHLGLPPAFEISATNVEKATLADDELRRRAAQFAWRAPLWLTQAPTYVEKARLFPGVVFLVGADTAARIVQSRFYGGEVEAALNEVRRAGCRFMVAGRVDASGTFMGLEELQIPERVKDLFAPLPGFRLDISSTLLRAERQE